MIKIILLGLLIVIIYIYINTTHIESLVNIPKIRGPVKYTRNKDCSYYMSKTIQQVLEKNNIPNTNKNDWVIYFPCTYNKMKKEIEDVTYHNPNQRIFLIDNCDQLSGKNTLWKNMVSAYGINDAKKIMPSTYLIYDDYDRSRLKNEFDKNKLYIMKKNIQRQEGLKITNNINEILDGTVNKYVVVQELLQNPYLINGRKINLRCYLLVVCQNEEIDAYVHHNGFMYYTAEKFKKNSVETGPNVTTGYIDRDVYRNHPLTHKDFRTYLDRKDRSLNDKEIMILADRNKISEHVFMKIYELLTIVMDGMRGVICHNNSHFKNAISFQLFGVDIALSDQLIPQIMEINKGPDLGAKDIRDKNVKFTVVEDMLKVMKIIPENKHGFVKVLE